MERRGPAAALRWNSLGHPSLQYGGRPDTSRTKMFFEILPQAGHAGDGGRGRLLIDLHFFLRFFPVGIDDATGGIDHGGWRRSPPDASEIDISIGQQAIEFNSLSRFGEQSACCPAAEVQDGVAIPPRVASGSLVSHDRRFEILIDGEHFCRAVGKAHVTISHGRRRGAPRQQQA